MRSSVSRFIIRPLLKSLMIFIMLIVLMLILGSSIMDYHPLITTGNAGQLEVIATLGRGVVRELLWTADDQQLIVASGNALSIYTMGEWDNPQIIEIEQAPLLDASLAPDGQTIALLENNLVRILDTTTWTEITRFEVVSYDLWESIASTIAYTGNTIVTWDSENRVYNIYDIQAQKRIYRVIYGGGDSWIINSNEQVAITVHNDRFSYHSLALENLGTDSNNQYAFASPMDILVTLENLNTDSGNQYTFSRRGTPPTYNRLTGADYQQEMIAITVIQPEQKQATVVIEDVLDQIRRAELTVEGQTSSIALAPADFQIALGMCSDDCPNYQVTLMNFMGNERRVLPGDFRNEISTIRFSQTGRFLAAANDSIVRVWDANRGETIAILLDNETAHSQIAVNNSYLAVSNEGVVLWDLDSLNPVAYLPCGDVIAMHTSLFLCGNELWVLEDEEAPRLRYHIPNATSIKEVTFNADGSLLIFIDDVGAMRLWDVNAQAMLATVSGFGTYDLRRLAISPDNQQIWTAQHIWDIAGLIEAQIVIADENTDIDNLPFITFAYGTGGWSGITLIDPEFEVLLHHRTDGYFVIDLETGQELYMIPFPSYHAIHAVYMIYNPNATLLAGSRCNDFAHSGACLSSSLELLDANTGEALFFTAHDNQEIRNLAFTPDGRWLVTGYSYLSYSGSAPLPDGNLRIWGIAIP